jgi:hypothetical protein
MSRGRQVIRLVAGGYALIDAIRRIWHVVFGRPQPIEWWLLGADLAIVFLIIWLDVPERFHRRRINKRVVTLFEYIHRGQLLKASSPHSLEDDKLVPSWLNAVKEWNAESLHFLESCSPQARAAFLISDETAHTREVSTVPLGARWSYGAMLDRLDNMRKIAENPDVYF